MRNLLLLVGMTLGLLLAAPLADADAQGRRPDWAPPGGPPGLVSAPELDAGSAGSALVLVLGGTAILLAGRRRGEEQS
jgi:hypothetical protein